MGRAHFGLPLCFFAYYYSCKHRQRPGLLPLLDGQHLFSHSLPSPNRGARLCAAVVEEDVEGVAEAAEAQGATLAEALLTERASFPP